MNEPLENRRLVAILFADIAGYTSFMQKDEQNTITKLDRFKDELDQNVPKYHGKIINFYGDGCLVVFENVSDAVDCAIKLQKAFAADPLVPVRMGIHLGDVVFRKDNAFGDSINIASRIESSGVPEAVLLSKSAMHQIRNQPEYQFVHLGSFDFKNVEEPIQVYAIASHGLKIPDRLEMRGKLKTSYENQRAYFKTRKGILVSLVILLSMLLGINYIFFSPPADGQAIESLAILPFINISQDPDLDFLSDGIPESLIHRLSAMEDVKIFSRNATFSFRDSLQDVGKIRELLDVDAVFTGQLSKLDDQLILNCQLIDAEDQVQIWGDRIKSPSSNVLEAEDALVASLLNPLKIQLINKSSIETRSVVPEAYTHYLKGRHLSYGSTSEEAEKALHHFRQAIRIDPKFAAAYAAIANEKIIQALFSTATREEIFGEARTAVQSAIALDPTLADAYLVKGAIKFYGDWDWAGAEKAFKKALKLDPNNANNYIRYSAVLAALQRHQESLELAEKAIELDPISISSLHNLGWVNLVAQNFDIAEDAFGKALELHPTWIWGHIKKAYAHMFQGDFEQAIQLTEQAEALLQDEWGSELIQMALLGINNYCGREEKSAALAESFLEHIRDFSYKDPYAVSVLYMNLGDLDKAFEWERRAIEERTPSSYLFNIKLFYDEDFFNHPRHQQVLSEMGLAL
jgi:class 3 adenylate cyclase/tetratricopeptide (TPR) repeat protein